MEKDFAGHRRVLGSFYRPFSSRSLSIKGGCSRTHLQCLSREWGDLCCRCHANMPPSLTCASVSLLILAPSMHYVRMKVWTGNTEAEQEQRLLSGFVLSLSHSSGLAVALVTCPSPEPWG